MSSYLLFISPANKTKKIDDTFSGYIEKATHIATNKPNSVRNGYQFSFIGRSDDEKEEAVIVRLKSRKPLEYPGRCVSSITRALLSFVNPEDLQPYMYNNNYLRVTSKDDPSVGANLLDYEVIQIVAQILLEHPASEEEKKLNAEAANAIREIAKEYRARH